MITIMLPAYNEAENLPPLLEKMQAVMAAYGEPYRVPVVDDGSTDATADVLERCRAKIPLEVVRHQVNMGLAQTLRDGLRRAADDASADDVIITMDADNTHEPNHIASMLERLAEGYDVVIASRYEPGGQEIGLSFQRHVLSRTANLLLKIFFPTRGVRDFTCGYRAYRADVLKRAWQVYGDRLIEATTFAAMAEVLLKLRLLGIRASEVPLVLRYDQKRGSSKMRVGRTMANYAYMVWRVRRARHLPQVRHAKRAKDL